MDDGVEKMETEKMRGQMSKEKQIRRFMWMLLLLSCAIFFLDYDEKVHAMDNWLLFDVEF